MFLEMIADFWWVFLLLFMVMVGGKCAYEDAVKQQKDRVRDIKYYGEPPNTACRQNGGGRHKWETGGWNSGIYHHGAVGRKGHRCYHCGEFAYKETDEEFILSFIPNQKWLLTSPSCSISERFIKYIPQEILDIRNQNIHDMEVDKTQRDVEYHREKEAACKARLLELQSA